MRNSCGSGLPTLRAVAPLPASMAATMGPVAGQAPSGIGKVRSRPAHTTAAPRSAARIALRSSR